MAEVLSMEQACEFLQLSKPCLYKYVRTGSIPAYKMGRVWKFHRDSLDQWLRSKVQEDTLARSTAQRKKKRAV